MDKEEVLYSLSKEDDHKMRKPKNAKEAMQYRNEVLAVYKQVYLEVHDDDEERLKRHMENAGINNKFLVYLEATISDMVIDHDIPWDTVETRARNRRVSAGTLDELYDVVVETATTQAKSAGFNGISTGMRRYISDEIFNEIYDKSAD